MKFFIRATNCLEKDKSLIGDTLSHFKLKYGQYKYGDVKHVVIEITRGPAYFDTMKKFDILPILQISFIVKFQLFSYTSAMLIQEEVSSAS